jgi:hypothetical protein
VAPAVRLLITGDRDRAGVIVSWLGSRGVTVLLIPEPGGAQPATSFATFHSCFSPATDGGWVCSSSGGRRGHRLVVCSSSRLEHLDDPGKVWAGATLGIADAPTKDGGLSMGTSSFRSKTHATTRSSRSHQPLARSGGRSDAHHVADGWVARNTCAQPRESERSAWTRLPGQSRRATQGRGIVVDYILAMGDPADEILRVIDEAAATWWR